MAEDLSSSGSWTDMAHPTHMTSNEMTLDPTSLKSKVEKRLSISSEWPESTRHDDSEAPHSADYMCSSTQPSSKAKPDEPDSTDRFKFKLMSAWNNMKHVWAVKTKTNFKVDSTLHLLGKEYPFSREEREAQREDIEDGRVPSPTSFDMFLDDFKSRIWLTYRKGFANLSGSPLNSDVGWGCMIRSGQMMLAQALLVHNLQRNWRLEYTEVPQLVTYRNIVRSFGDFDNDICPFSLHKLVQIGEHIGKKPGDWYGPSSVAFVLRDAVEIAQNHAQFKKDFSIYVAQDCTVYKQDVIDLCTYKEVMSQDNSSSSSPASPATLSKHSHPSPTVKNIEHLDIPKAKEKAAFYRKLGIMEARDSAHYHTGSSHHHHNHQELRTVSGMCDNQTVHRTASHSNGSSLIQTVQSSKCQSSYETDFSNSEYGIDTGCGAMKQTSNGGSPTNGSPLNPLYGYKSDNGEKASLSNSRSKVRMGRVTSLNLSEALQHTTVSDILTDDVFPNTRNVPNHHTDAEAAAQKRFNPFDGKLPPPVTLQHAESSSSSSQHNNQSFLHDNYGTRPHKYDSSWRPVLILIPVRLGGIEFNPVYARCLKRVLQSQFSVGIIGGRPKHSLYFVGWQDEKLLYLDPHFCQEHVDVTDPNFPIQSFQCESPRKMSFSKLDPSCTLGFYCRTQNDFNTFIKQSERMASPPNKARGVYPLYVFSDGRSTDVNYAQEEERHLRLRRLDRHGRPKQRHPSKESNDDFVML